MMNLLEKGLRYEGKSKFREWIELEELKNLIAKATEGSSGTFPDRMFDFLLNLTGYIIHYFKTKTGQAMNDFRCRH